MARRRMVRLLVRGIAGYVAIVVVVQAVTIAAILLARMADTGSGPTAPGGISNFRMVDDKVWMGAQPDDDAYRALARRGVTAVVDLRTGAPDDPQKDDPDLLAELGMVHRRLPVADGHVPARGEVDVFLATVRSTPGVVFVHCGGGVGRTSALEAAYIAAMGREPGITRFIARGPLTLEQAWVIARSSAGSPGTPNIVVRRVSELLDAPRRGFSRLRALL